MSTNDIQAVAFDVDGTLIEFKVWPALHKLFNFPMEEDRRLHALYHDGRLSYRDWMEGVYGGYVARGMARTKKEIDPIVLDFDFVPDARKVMDALREKYPLAVISSSLADYVVPVGEALGIPHAYAFTALSYDPEGAYQGIKYLYEGNEIDMKITALKDFGAKVGAEPHEIAFVGDSINDVGAFRHTGRGILIEGSRHNDSLREAAWKRINTLSEVLDIL